MTDHACANFPWVPKTLPELLGDIVLNREGAELSRSTVLALYFSAHRCSPSSDSHPSWKRLTLTSRRFVLPFDNERYQSLSSHFEVEGIPALVVVNPEVKVITTKGHTVGGAES